MNHSHNQSQASVLVGRICSFRPHPVEPRHGVRGQWQRQSNRPDRGACTQQMIERGLRNDHLASVLLVKEFKQGDYLLLSGTPTANTPKAASDLCFAKINVGPGNPGPVGAPSTSPGIGIEIWLPTPANWNKRIHNKGGGGWAGGPHSTLTGLVVNSGSAGSAPRPRVWRVPCPPPPTPGTPSATVPSR